MDTVVLHDIYFYSYQLASNRIDYDWVGEIRIYDDSIFIMYAPNAEGEREILGRVGDFIIIIYGYNYWIHNINNSKEQLEEFMIFCSLFNYEYDGDINKIKELLLLFISIKDTL